MFTVMGLLYSPIYGNSFLHCLVPTMPTLCGLF
ncbi:hypothetical protein bas69_0052 [Escherichia phage AlfredRasser]|nr:hypothetical protein bas69_0052 [Escherichia phage AlfredRasser]